MASETPQLIILTGIAIASVVGLYASDVLPRREDVPPSTTIAWPEWGFNRARQDYPPPTAEPVQNQSQSAPYDRQPAYTQPPYPQPGYPQQSQPADSSRGDQPQPYPSTPPPNDAGNGQGEYDGDAPPEGRFEQR